MDVIKYLSEQYEGKDIGYAVRFNGVIDISKKKKAVFNIVEKSWYYPAGEDDLLDYVINHLEFYEELPDKKSSPAARSTWKQAKRKGYKKTQMDDNSLMPFGKHKDEKMANVPAEYLIWIFENAKCFGPVKEYIQANEVNLRQEIALSKKQNRR